MQTDLTNFIEIQPENILKILELIKEFDGTQDDLLEFYFKDLWITYDRNNISHAMGCNVFKFKAIEQQNKYIHLLVNARIDVSYRVNVNFVKLNIWQVVKLMYESRLLHKETGDLTLSISQNFLELNEPTKTYHPIRDTSILDIECLSDRVYRFGNIHVQEKYINFLNK